MRRTFWHDDATPIESTLDRVFLEIRLDDAAERLLLDSVSLADIIEDSDGAMVFDALVTPYAKLQPKMEVLRKVMLRAGGDIKPIDAPAQISAPFMQNGTANVAAIFELSDGQTITIFFHNPDTTPKKILPTDELISWKWLLNKKDITIVVAPEKGLDLNPRQVAVRIMKLAEKNSASFIRSNGKRAERMQALEDLKTEITGLEMDLKGALHRLEVAVNAIDPRKALDPIIEPEVIEPVAEPVVEGGAITSTEIEKELEDLKPLIGTRAFDDKIDPLIEKIFTAGLMPDYEPQLVELDRLHGNAKVAKQGAFEIELNGLMLEPDALVYLDKLEQIAVRVEAAGLSQVLDVKLNEVADVLTGLLAVAETSNSLTQSDKKDTLSSTSQVEAANVEGGKMSNNLSDLKMDDDGNFGDINEAIDKLSDDSLMMKNKNSFTLEQRQGMVTANLVKDAKEIAEDDYYDDETRAKAQAIVDRLNPKEPPKEIKVSKKQQEWIAKGGKSWENTEKTVSRVYVKSNMFDNAAKLAAEYGRGELPEKHKTFIDKSGVVNTDNAIIAYVARENGYKVKR